MIKPFYQDEPSPTREIITYDGTNYLVEHEGYCSKPSTFLCTTSNTVVIGKDGKELEVVENYPPELTCSECGIPAVIKPPDKPKRMVKDVAGIQKPLME